MRLFTGLLLVLIVSCSEKEITPAIAPPTWIQGSWVDETNTINYIFTPSNVVQSSFGISVDFSQINESDEVEVKQTISTGRYILTITGGGVTQSHKFAEVDGSHMNYSLIQGGVSISLLFTKK